MNKYKDEALLVLAVLIWFVVQVTGCGMRPSETAKRHHEITLQCLETLGLLEGDAFDAEFTRCEAELRDLCKHNRGCP